MLNIDKHHAVFKIKICGHGGTADALVSGTSESNLLQVQILLTAPKFYIDKGESRK